jgi:hypothetical protein
MSSPRRSGIIHNASMQSPYSLRKDKRHVMLKPSPDYALRSRMRTPLTLIRAGRSSLRWQGHVEATGSTSSNPVHANTQALRSVNLPIGVTFLLETGVASRKSLCTVANDLEYVDSESVCGVVELLIEALAHILLLDWLMDERGDERLRVPIGESVHDSNELFIGVDWSIACLFILEGSIGVDGSLCGGR